ncbi:procollagen galactosyltransferase [Aureococcus anophagefferens]|nr:procollagen galactosyltransferase [Aureococcus anophagefferens]
MACEDDVRLDVGSAGAAASTTTTTTTATATHVIIINLASRRDRRAFMEASCAAPLRDRGVAVEFLDAVTAAACGARACAAYAVHEGFALGDDALDALVACARSHVAAWRRAAARFADDAALEKVLVLEDDAVPCLGPVRAADWAGVYGAAWAALVARLAKTTLPSDVDLFYVGRHRLGPDGGPAGAVCYPAGFSSCLHAYALTRRGAARLGAISGNFLRRVVPADDFVPALCGVHPRRDLVDDGLHFVAAAFSPEAAHQLCSVALPGDALAGAAASSIEVDGDGWRWARPSLYVGAAEFAAGELQGRDALGDDAAWRALAQGL